jgi:hypothetical protein
MQVFYHSGRKEGDLDESGLHENSYWFKTFIEF